VELGVLEVDADDAAARSGPLVKDALAAAHVEQRRGSRPGEQLVERALEAAMRRRTTGFVEPYLS
jgi:hypothetical protein